MTHAKMGALHMSRRPRKAPVVRAKSFGASVQTAAMPIKAIVMHVRSTGFIYTFTRGTYALGSCAWYRL